MVLPTTLIVLLVSLAAGLPAVRADEPADLATRRGEDWGAFLGPTGNGRSSLAALKTPWAAAGPEIVWHTSMGEGYCSPAVALGRAVVFDRIGGECRLRCLHAETGRSLWEHRYPTAYVDTFGYDCGPRAAPVIAHGRVLSFGPEGRLECRRLEDGESLWQVDTAAAYHVVQNFFGVGAAPLVLEFDGRRLVVVQVGGSRPGSAPPSPERLELVKGLDSGLVAFDLETGREVWRASDQLASYSTPVVTLLGGQRRILAWMRDDFLVVDPAGGGVGGRFRWRADDVFSAVAASPVVSGEQVLLSEAYEPGSVLLDLAAIAGPDGRQDGGAIGVLRQDRRGSRPDRALKAHWATPVLHDGHLYGESGRNSGDAVLACVDWKTGAVGWSEGGYGRASATLACGHLVVLGEYGDLALVRATPARYEEVSRVRIVGELTSGREADLLTPPCWAAPVIARGLLYVRGKDRLVCLDLTDAQ
ncbi:MAG: PQQ-binding-like beta-propeller repeat protein [Planctomycetota bacterium]